MKSIDSAHAHEHDVPEPEPIEVGRLPRRISRKATSAESPPDRMVLPSPPWVFGNAINAGIQRKASGEEFATNAASLLSSAGSSSGSSLPSTIQRKFEDSLGADLSSVRVHTGSESAEAASAISARAYTTGQDIHFAAGQYDPSTPGGEHLLAHEVAHTVQQGSGGDLQCKLEVSSPGDQCEVEADRAADAMVSGSVFRVTSGAGVQRKIMRDGDETAGTSTGPTPRTGSEPSSETPRTGETGETSTGGTGGTGPTSTDGTGTGGSGTTGPEMVPTHWRINYDRIYGGARRSGRAAPGERTESSILHVREFRVQPEHGTTTPATPFSGYHLQNSGAVEMGSVQHPRGAGGEASASISYMRDGDVHLSVNGPRSGRHAVESRIAGELSRQSSFPDDLGAAATALLTDADRAAGRTTVTATTRRGAEVAVTPIPLRYPAINADSTMDVMVEVPVGERRVIAESTGGGETEDVTGATAGATHEEGSEATHSTTDVTRMVTAIEARFEMARETVSRHVAQEMVRNRLEFNQQFELGGEAGGTLSAGIPEFSVGLTDLLAFIPGIGEELSSLLHGLGPEITFAINAQLQMQVHARTTTTFTGEHTTETTTTDEDSIRRAISGAMSARWESTVEHQVTDAVRTSRSDARTAGSSDSHRSTTRTGSTSRSEGTAVAQTDVPRLILRR